MVLGLFFPSALVIFTAKICVLKVMILHVCPEKKKNKQTKKPG